MKIDPHKPNPRFRAVKHFLIAICIAIGVFAPSNMLADESAPDAVPAAPIEDARSQPQATALLGQVLQYLVDGPAFDAKVRETVWTTGREVVGVGNYEQAGGGSGRFNLHMTMFDGDGKHRFQQISDGRLAWTRTEIASEVSLRRVDVGRLDEWVQATGETTSISPRLRVGAWAEMLTTIQRDHVLTAASYKLKGESVWVISAELKQSRRSEVLAESNSNRWPELYPTRIRIAVAAKNNPETGFGQWLPIHIEFRGDPITTAKKSDDEPDSAPISPNGPLIALIELYSVRPIQPPPLEQFRFENQDTNVIFVNETDRYLEMYGVRLTDRERRQLLR